MRWLRSSLLLKGAVPLLVVPVAAILALVPVTRSSVHRSWDEIFAGQSEGVAVHLAAQHVRYGGDVARLERELDQVSATHPDVVDIDLYETGAEGPTLVASTEREAPREPLVGWERAAVAAGTQAGRELNVNGVQTLRALHPLRIDGRLIGVAGVSFDLSERNAVVARAQRGVTASIAMSSGLSVLVLSAAFYMFVVRRLLRISRGVARVRTAGEVSVPLREQVGGCDELAGVAVEIDRLIGSAEARSQRQRAVAELGSLALESERAEFVAEACRRIRDALSVTRVELVSGEPEAEETASTEGGAVIEVPGGEFASRLLVEASRALSDEDLDCLRVTASLIGSALARFSDRAALNESETRFRTLVESIPAIVFIAPLDDITTATYVSPQVESVIGYTPEEWRATPELWVQSIHPDDRERVVRFARLANAGHVDQELEYRILAKDGSTRWLRDTSTVICDDAGTPSHRLGIVTDVTERELADASLRESEERFRQFADHVDQVLWMVDVSETGERRPLFVNPAFERHTGVPLRDFYDRPDGWREVVHPDDLDSVEAERIRATEGPTEQTFRIVRPDGDVRWVRDRTFPVRNDSGEVYRIAGIDEDVTDQMKAAEALTDALERERSAAVNLRDADEMKNTFLQAVSHELRTPLAVIVGSAMTLEGRIGEMPAGVADDLLRRLTTNANRLDQLVSDLLDIDRLNAGLVQLHRQPTEAGSLVRRVVEAMDLNGRVVQVEAEPMAANVDGPKLERVVEHLVSNAVKYSPPESRVMVRVLGSHGGVRVVVEDHGPGIADENKRAVFEPFRGGPMRSAHAPGTGIGLALVHRLVQLHGGQVWVEDRIGGGACFVVDLPAEQPAAAELVGHALAR